MDTLGVRYIYIYNYNIYMYIYVYKNKYILCTKYIDIYL